MTRPAPPPRPDRQRKHGLPTAATATTQREGKHVTARKWFGRTTILIGVLIAAIAVVASASAGKKASRTTKQGTVGSYIHAGAQLGVLVEVNCESDFVARTDDFQELVRDIAMHIAAADPQFVRKEDVTPAAIEKEKDIARARALGEGKPEKILDKIVEGRLAKYYEEVCLMEQPFIKENTTTIADVIKTKIAGTTVNVRTSESIDTSSSNGEIFHGTVAEDVMARGGRIVIPRGSRGRGGDLEAVAL